MEQFEITKRNKVKRLPARGHYDKKTLHEILDDGFLCHMGFVVDGQPFVIPTLYGREGDRIYVHGATTSRMLKKLQEGIPVCMTVTLVDGIVLARSAFHHSMNYRSAVVYGKAQLMNDSKKETAMEIISENVLKGRWDEARKPNPKELKATSVLSIEVEQASCKIRTGPPGDDKEDYDLDIWAGVLPIQTGYGQPIADELLKDGVPMAKSVEQVVAPGSL